MATLRQVQIEETLRELLPSPFVSVFSLRFNRSRGQFWSWEDKTLTIVISGKLLELMPEPDVDLLARSIAAGFRARGPRRAFTLRREMQKLGIPAEWTPWSEEVNRQLSPDAIWVGRCGNGHTDNVFSSSFNPEVQRLCGICSKHNTSPHDRVITYYPWERWKLIEDGVPTEWADSWT